MVTLKYFGAIAEQARKAEETIAIDNQNLKAVLAAIDEKYSLSASEYRIAVNKKLIDNADAYVLEANDIIAFLPPFAGG